MCIYNFRKLLKYDNVQLKKGSNTKLQNISNKQTNKYSNKQKLGNGDTSESKRNVPGPAGIAIIKTSRQTSFFFVSP